MDLPVQFAEVFFDSPDSASDILPPDHWTDGQTRKQIGGKKIPDPSQRKCPWHVAYSMWHSPYAINERGNLRDSHQKLILCSLVVSKA
jgi:hypothetical protein